MSIKIRFSKNDFLILPTFPIVNVLKWVFLVLIVEVVREISNTVVRANITRGLLLVAWTLLAGRMDIIGWSHGHY